MKNVTRYDDVVITDLGSSRVIDNSSVRYEFMSLNGERLRDVVVSDYVDTFLRRAYKANQTVTLKTLKGGMGPVVMSIRLPDGEVIQADIQRAGIIYFNFLRSFLYAFVLAIVCPSVTYFFVSDFGGRAQNEALFASLIGGVIVGFVYGMVKLKRNLSECREATII